MAARGLSEKEIWDDSALVRSWNDALEEYKKYHSMAAKGEKVEVVLDAAETGDGAVQEETPATDGAQDIDPATGLPAWKTYDETSPSATEPIHARQPEQMSGIAKPTNGANGSSSRPPTDPAVPQALMGTVQDEALRNVMMSWYYAGYYTGLHEGQQKAYAAMQAASELGQATSGS